MVPVVLALTAAFAFGAIDQYLQVVIPVSSHLGAYQFLVQVSNGMSASWLLVPFVAGAWQAGRLRAALVGLVATWLPVLAYVLMIVSPMEGTHVTPRALAFGLASQWPWFAGGLVTGPLYGWLGHRWRARRSPATALLAALPVLLEPAARWLAAALSVRNLAWLPFQWPLGGRRDCRRIRRIRRRLPAHLHGHRGHDARPGLRGGLRPAGNRFYSGTPG